MGSAPPFSPLGLIGSNRKDMNRILYVARKAKGITGEQVAKLLSITIEQYNGLEHSLSDLTAGQAVKLAKFYNIEPELLLYSEGRDKRLITFAMDEVSKIVAGIKKENMPQQAYFNLIALGNTALTLQVELGNALYRQFELERDNEAIRKLNKELQQQLGSKL